MNGRTGPYTVLIVDGRPATREALRWLLENEPDLVVVGEAGRAELALALATTRRPDAVVLDIELPGADGYALVTQLKALPAPPVVVVMAAHGGWVTRWRSRTAGVDGFVEMSTGYAALLATLRLALATRDNPSKA